MAPNSKNDDGYQFARTKSTWKPNFAQIGGFLYPWRPFWIQNGRHSKTTININSQHHNLLGKPNFAQIGGFVYFDCQFGFKIATIANQHGRHMVQHVLLPVNIHFH
jgi:hypothetical protein